MSGTLARPAADGVRPLLEAAEARLRAAGVETPRLDAELLLAGVLGVGRMALVLHAPRPDPGARAAFERALARRAAREPLQYILGEAAFRELVLRVDRRVLIPRPETEELVGQVLAWAAQRGGPLDALDIGTGSGAIALSLLAEGPFERAVATDPSADALAVAGENARRAGLEGRLELRRGPGWSPLAPGERFDVVVSNPPYVAEAERAGLQPEVGRWEPAGALFAGPDGLDLIRELVAGAPAHARPGGLLALEVGCTQARTVAAWLRADGAFEDVRIVVDMAGRERAVRARRTHGEEVEE
ncbi:MAG TPA: peptide chain release factor N(5)-glutamine methyltransferase [Longimicrobiales bacterium]|nr:peptide chain release factor N(5)-glutamine methyltransferase [Longimicrobiales bacterium]